MGRMVGNAFLATLAAPGKAAFVFQLAALKRHISAGGTRANYDPIVRARAASLADFERRGSSPAPPRLAFF